MKIRRKSLCLLIMLLAVIWLGASGVSAATIIPTDVDSASSDCILLGVKGEYITEIPQALKRINEIRREACQEGVRNPNTGTPLKPSDYVPIKWSSDLEYIARIRAAESGITMAHKRTNGRNCFQIMSPGHIKSSAEVLAWDWERTMIDGIEIWYEEKADWVNQVPGAVTGHYTEMINPSNTYVGLGTFYSEDTQYPNTTAGEFSSETGLNETQGTAVKNCIQILEFDNAYCSGAYRISGGSSAKPGKSSQLKMVTDITLKNGFGTVTTLKNLQVMDSIVWKSSDESIASVDDNGAVMLHTCGKVTVTASDGRGHKTETTLEGTHDWDFGKITKKATASTKGEKVYTCQICHVTKTEEIPPLTTDTPGKPSLDKISAPAYNKIQISWKKTLNVSKYVIYYRKTGTAKWTQLASVNCATAQYTHTSSAKYPIIVGQNYDYTVKSYNQISKKYSAYDVKGLTAKTLPATPQLVKAVINSDNTVTVNWKKSEGCNSYRIYRKTTLGKWTQIGSVKSSVLKFTDKNPVADMQNTYTVRGYYSKTKTAGKYDEQGVSINMKPTERPVTPTPSQPAVPTPIPIPPGVHPTLITDISLSRRSVDLTVKGQRVMIDSMILPGKAYYKMLGWVSSNPSVATVSAHDNLADSRTYVTAVGNGTAVITAYALDGSGLTAQCKITVNYKDDNGTSELPTVPDDKNTFVKLKSIKLNPTSVTISDKNKKYKIQTIFSPDNATTKACRWTSSDNSVVLANSGWANVFSETYLTPTGNGTAVLTAHALDGSGVTAKCVVHVTCF